MNKKIKLSAVILLLAVCGLLLFSSCAMPSPLYGKWADAAGGQIAFMSDGSFTAKIVTDGISTLYDGTYEVLANVISFTTSDRVIVTEWDMRGNILYLKWPSPVTTGAILNLTLYKIAN